MQSFSHEIDWLKARVSQDPGSMFYARLADHYLQNNDVDQAMEFAEKAALMHPHDATARFVLAKCCYVKQDFDKADKNLNETLLLDPHHLGALDLQADLFGGRGETDRAKDNINQLIDLDPLNEAVHLKNVDFPQSSAKETFEDDWNAAMLPEEERPETKFDSQDDSFSEFELETTEPESGMDEIDFDSKWEMEKTDNSFEFDQQDDSFELERPDDSFRTEPLVDDSVQGESFHDDPFSDFEETTRVDEPAPMETVPTIEEPTPLVENEPFDFEEPDESSVDEDFSGDHVLDESLDDDFEIDKSKFREEKSKFTRLLDDIFSSNLEEEEQREHAARSAIEQIAGSEPQVDESIEEPAPAKPHDDFEPLMSPDEIIFPEDKILESDRSQHDDLVDFNAVEDVQEESRDSRSEDFSNFLDSLDIKDDSKTEKELPDGFDDPLPKLDDDFDMSEDLKNILQPQSAHDDWSQNLSDAASEEPVSDPLDDFKFEPEPESEKGGDIPPAESSAKDEKGKFYTPTLGEIYAAQGQYAKAISVYENLLKGDPDNDLYQSKLEVLRKKLAEQQ